MRKVLSTALLIIIVFTAWKSYSLWPVQPCTKPILYSLGTFDNRFGLSQEAFLSALKEAEAIWEEPLRGKGLSPEAQLFEYSPQGKLKVNLVYDYRQKATKDLSSIENTLDKGNAQYREMDAVYKKRKGQYDALKTAYDNQTLAWEAHRKAYEAEVDRWNASSRTSQSDFQALESDRIALETEAANLKETEEKLNVLAKDVNVLVAQLNSLAKDLNLGVLQYNEVGKTRGETFTDGLYTSNEDGERIDVFQFEKHDELVHLLAHELGHALGLEHVNDPAGIMYYINQKSSLSASAADVTALKTLCGVE